MNLEKIKETAKELSSKVRLKVLLYTAITGIIIYGILYLLINWLNNTGASLELRRILVIIAYFIIIILNFGLFISLYKIYKNDKNNLISPLTNSIKYFGKIVGTIFFTFIHLLLPIIAIIASNVLISTIFPISYLKLYLITAAGTLLQSLKFLSIIDIIILLLFIVLYIWFISGTYYYKLTLYLFVDNKNDTSFNIVKTSKKLMEGRRFDLFLLELYFSFILGFTLIVSAICFNFLVNLLGTQILSIMQILYLIFCFWYILLYWFPYQLFSKYVFYNEITGTKQNDKEIISGIDEQNNLISTNENTLGTVDNIEDKTIISDDIFAATTTTEQVNANLEVQNNEVIPDDMFTANTANEQVNTNVEVQNSEVISDDIFTATTTTEQVNANVEVQNNEVIPDDMFTTNTANEQVNANLEVQNNEVIPDDIFTATTTTEQVNTNVEVQNNEVIPDDIFSNK